MSGELRRAKVVTATDDEGDDPVAPKHKTIAGMPWWLAAVIAGVVALPILGCGGILVLAAVLPKTPAGAVAAGELPPVAFSPDAGGAGPPAPSRPAVPRDGRR